MKGTRERFALRRQRLQGRSHPGRPFFEPAISIGGRRGLPSVDSVSIGVVLRVLATHPKAHNRTDISQKDVFVYDQNNLLDRAKAGSRGRLLRRAGNAPSYPERSSAAPPAERPRINQQTTLMNIGMYNEPKGAYLPFLVFQAPTWTAESTPATSQREERRSKPHLRATVGRGRRRDTAGLSHSR